MSKASLILVCVLPSFACGAWTWTTLDYPGATSGTTPCGVSGNRIVGFVNAGTSGAGPAFAFENGVWTVLEYPGATDTDAYGIGGDRIVGRYVDANGKRHGFVLDGSVWTTLDYPPANIDRISTYALSVSGSNIVGYYQDCALGGFLFDGVTWTSLRFPGSGETLAYGVFGSRVVGQYGFDTGFVYEDGTWTSLAYPGASYTGAFGIWEDTITGHYSDDTATHGFLYQNGVWTSLDYPGSIGTVLHGICENRIVGAYTDASGNSHGFLLTLPEPAALLLCGLASLCLCRRHHGHMQLENRLI